MRIGLDLSPLSHGHPRGLARVTAGLHAALSRRARIEVVGLSPAPRANLRRWRQVEIPLLVQREGLAGVHSCVSAFAWRGRGRRVQTIHELPWKHGARENAGLRHRAWAAIGPMRADLVLTATEFVARDLRRRFLPGASKIRVCPWGKDERFAGEPPPGVVDEVVLARYRMGENPLALCLGAVRAKKNLAAAIRGLAEVRKRGGPPIQLVVTGGDTPDLRKDLGLVARSGLSRFVSTIDEIAEEDLPSILRLASVVIVLSRSEGFGLPALEAMASGTPVLVARDTAQSEVAGSAGIAVDADDPLSVADGMERAVRDRELLREPSLARASDFTWERCAARVEELWLAWA